MTFLLYANFSQQGHNSHMARDRPRPGRHRPKKYTAHSYRGAGLSHAFEKGGSITEIMKAGNLEKVGDLLQELLCYKHFVKLNPSLRRVRMRK